MLIIGVKDGMNTGWLHQQVTSITPSAHSPLSPALVGRVRQHLQ
jgi:hypothetical protein